MAHSVVVLRAATAPPPRRKRVLRVRSERVPARLAAAAPHRERRGDPPPVRGKRVDRVAAAAFVVPAGSFERRNPHEALNRDVQRNPRENGDLHRVELPRAHKPKRGRTSHRPEAPIPWESVGIPLARKVREVRARAFDRDPHAVPLAAWPTPRTGTNRKRSVPRTSASARPSARASAGSGRHLPDSICERRGCRLATEPSEGTCG